MTLGLRLHKFLFDILITNCFFLFFFQKQMTREQTTQNNKQTNKIKTYGVAARLVARLRLKANR